jgi:hypothetical protein
MLPCLKLLPLWDAIATAILNRQFLYGFDYGSLSLSSRSPLPFISFCRLQHHAPSIYAVATSSPVTRCRRVVSRSRVVLLSHLCEATHLNLPVMLSSSSLSFIFVAGALAAAPAAPAAGTQDLFAPDFPIVAYQLAAVSPQSGACDDGNPLTDLIEGCRCDHLPRRLHGWQRHEDLQLCSAIHAGAGPEHCSVHHEHPRPRVRFDSSRCCGTPILTCKQCCNCRMRSG